MKNMNILRNCRRVVRNFQVRNVTSYTLRNQKFNSFFNLRIDGIVGCPSIKTEFQLKRFCEAKSLLSLFEYDAVVNDTLEDLADHFDFLADEGFFDDHYDSTIADGVLTVYLGVHGTYVINKQTPNRQLWLSSPISGPKRYDFQNSTWLYAHEPERCLHELLTDEVSEMLKTSIDFTQLTYGKKSL